MSKHPSYLRSAITALAYLLFIGCGTFSVEAEAPRIVDPAYACPQVSQKHAPLVWFPWALLVGAPFFGVAISLLMIWRGKLWS
jgi:hypothetical protein